MFENDPPDPPVEIIECKEIEIKVLFRLYDYSKESVYGRNPYLGRYRAEVTTVDDRSLIAHSHGHSKEQAMEGMWAKINGAYYRELMARDVD